MVDAELRAKAKLEGGKETADGLGKIADAQGRVTEEGERGTKTAKAATEATKKLSASTEDYTSLLGRIHPALGGFADAMVKGARAAGDLASRQINLRGALRKATTAIRNNAAALKLIGAGGAVVLAIAAIAKAVQAMRDEFTRATEAARKNTEALNEQREQAKALEKQYLATANARRNMEAPTVAEAAAGTARSKRIAEKYGIAPELAATVGGDVAGLGLDFETEASLAMMREAGIPGAEFEPLQPAGSRQGQIRAAIARNQDFLQRRRQQVQEARRRRVQEAYRELVAYGGSTTALEAEVEPFLLPGQDPKQFAETLKKIGPNYRAAREGMPSREDDPSYAGKVSLRTVDPQGWVGGWFADRLIDVDAQVARQMEAFLNQFFDRLKNGEAAGAGAPTVNIYNRTEHNARNYGPDARSFESRVTNGEKLNAEWE